MRCPDYNTAAGSCLPPRQVFPFSRCPFPTCGMRRILLSEKIKKITCTFRFLCYNHSCSGVLAQLGERKVRNLEVRGSIPLCSIENPRKTVGFLLSKYQKYQKSTKDRFFHAQEAGFFMSQQLLDDPGWNTFRSQAAGEVVRVTAQNRSLS